MSWLYIRIRLKRQGFTTIMDERCCLFLGIILCFTLVSESRVIVPRGLPSGGSSGNGEFPLSINPLEKDKKLGLKPLIRGPFTEDDDFNVYEDDKPINHPRGPIDDYDYFRPDITGLDNFPGIKPERFPSRADPNEWPETKHEENDDTATDDNFKKTFDDENSYIPDKNDKDLGPSFDDNKTIHKDGDEPEIADTDTKEFEDNNNDEDFKPKDKGRPDEEKEENDIPEDNQEKPDAENDKPEDDDEKTDEGKEENEKPEDGEEKPDDEEEMNRPKEDEEKEEEEEHDSKDDKEKPDEEGKEDEKYKPENDDEKNYNPEEEPIDNRNKDEELPKEVDEETVDNEDEESIHEAEEAELSSGGSIFDNPFFNLEQVKKYFSTLERALGHVFRQTVDEAILLNGTYANTTEEEVEIDGKKYIITKSVIKGGDNHSSLYVESLSSKPKMNESEVIEDIKIKDIITRR